MAEVASKEALGEIQMAAKNIRAQLDHMLALKRRLPRGPEAMAAGVSKENLGGVLTQAKLAAANIRAHLERLQELRLQLQEEDPPGDAVELQEMGFQAMDAYFSADIGAGNRYLGSAFVQGVENGAPITSDAGFDAAVSAAQLYDALLAQRFPVPRCPTTSQSEAFARIESAIYAVKLAQEHYLLCYADHLGRAAVETPPASGEPPQDVLGLDRASTLVELAVKHVDIANDIMSSFLDPMEVAVISDFADKYGVIPD